MVKTVGRYLLGRTIGNGTYGKVKICTDSQTGQNYAVKIIEKQQLLGDGMEEQLRREITIMKQLHHPHIIEIVEVMQSAKNVYIVLEYVTGGELFNQIVAAKRFPEDKARPYFQQLIMALRYCHRHGICHRDLKPENLLLDSQERLKLADFGLANLQNTTKSGRVTDEYKLHTLCGTPHYVAPEVLKDEGYNGFHADIWSCGVILFVMLAGRLPFNDKDREQLFLKVKNGNYQMSQHIPKDAADLISKMLTVDVRSRYTLDDVIAHPWFQHNWDPAHLEVGDWSVPHVDNVAAAYDPYTHLSDDNTLKPTASAEEEQAQSSVPSSGSTGNSLQIGEPGPTAPTFVVDRGGWEQSYSALLRTLQVMHLRPKAWTEGSSVKISCYAQAAQSLLSFVCTVDRSPEGNAVVQMQAMQGDPVTFSRVHAAVVSALNVK